MKITSSDMNLLSKSKNHIISDQFISYEKSEKHICIKISFLLGDTKEECDKN
jgi:hypothetical protein